MCEDRIKQFETYEKSYLKFPTVELKQVRLTYFIGTMDKREVVVPYIPVSFISFNIIN